MIPGLSDARVRHRSGHLRPEPSPFLGRASELEQLDAESAGAGDVITIVGPPGIGKTRLALRYATTRQHAYASVWFCDMSEASDVEEMTSLALRAFAKGSGALDAATAMTRALAARPGALVILDNLEHLMPGAATVVRRWVASAPDVRFIVTSRVPLEVPGERTIRLGALAVPAPGDTAGEAVDLFVDRVRGRLSSYAPADDELEGVAEIVRRLRGVPLAIELAAARVGEARARELAREVPTRSITPSDDEAYARRAVLRAFALLAPRERSVLCQCAVFRGSFTLNQAERVLEVEGAAASDVVVELAQKHLLQIERFQPIRFSACEAIRALATHGLPEDELASAERRHAEYMAERAARIANPEGAPSDAGDDWDDLRAAMAYGARERLPDVVAKTAIAIDALGGSLNSAQIAWLDEALGMLTGDRALLARALGVRAAALAALGRWNEARRDAAIALEIASAHGDKRQVGDALRTAARSAFQLGALEEGLARLEEALAIERARGDVAAIVAVHQLRGSIYQSLGDVARAREELQRSLALAVRTGNAAGEARATMSLAWDRFEAGDRDGARESFERALVIARRLKLSRVERISVGYLGVLGFEEGDLEAAEDHLRQAAFASRRAGDFPAEGFFEGVRAAVLATLDCVEESRASFELAEQLLAGNAVFGGAIAIHRGHLDLAEARLADAKGWHQKAATLVLEAHARVEAARTGDPPLVTRSDDARLAVLILERALETG